MRKPYPAYRDSGIEWIGKIPGNWNLSKIKYLLKIEMGQSPSSESYNDEEVGMPFLQGNTEFGIEYPIVKKWTPEITKLSKLGDILFSVRGSVAEINWSDKEYCIGRGLCAIRPVNYNPKLLWYFLLISKDEFLSLSVGSTFLSVSTDDILNFILLNIPQTEQKQIVKYLDYKTKLIDDLIEKTKQKIKLLKEKRTSLINHCVTKGLNPKVEMKDSGIEWIGKIPINWIILKFKYLSKIITGNTPSKDQEDIYYSDSQDGYTWIKPTSLDKGFRYVTESEEYLTEEGKNQTRLIPKDSIMVCCIGNTIGKYGISGKELSTNQQINTVIPNQNLIHPFFCLFYIDVFVKDLYRIANFVTLPIYTKSDLENTPIILPPMKEQIEIVNRITGYSEVIDTLIEKENKRIELLKEYRQSLISEAVTGKIDVRDEVIA